METFFECGSKHDILLCRDVSSPFWTNYVVMSSVLAVSCWLIALTWVHSDDLVSLKDCSKWEKVGSVPANRGAQEILD